jgi:hypothetical protein
MARYAPAMLQKQRKLTNADGRGLMEINIPML